MHRTYRYGASLLGASALLFAVFPFIRPFFPLDPRQPLATLEVASPLVTSPSWFIAHMLLLVAFVFLIFGIGTIARCLDQAPASRHLALVGLATSCAGIGLILPMLGIEAYALPIIGRLFQDGLTDVSTTIPQIYAGPAFAVCLIGLLLLAIGAGLIAVSVWRSTTMPKVPSILFAVGLATWFPAFPETVRIINGVLIGIGGLWLAGHIWAQSKPQRWPTKLAG